MRSAEVQLTVRSQQLTTVDGELGYYGQFPIKLEADTLTTNARGEAAFTLPAAAEPSRFLLTALATDGAAYRVKTTREMLVERGQSSFTLHTEQQFSAPNTTVTFAFRTTGSSAAPTKTKPVSWEWVRLEDRKRATGALVPLIACSSLSRGRLLHRSPPRRSRQHRGRRAALGDRRRHAPAGWHDRDRAEQGALSGGRDGGAADHVSDAGRRSAGDAGARPSRGSGDAAAAAAMGDAESDGANEWRARVPIRETFAPNITFSVVYVKDGEYVFQNQGLTVTQPTIDIALQTDKEVYAPGERVDVQVTTTVGTQAGRGDDGGRRGRRDDVRVAAGDRARTSTTSSFTRGGTTCGRPRARISSATTWRCRAPGAHRSRRR